MSQLKAYQRKYGLLDDGKLGKNTLKTMLATFHIPRIEHLAHFAGQMAHESGNFTRASENLNYSAEGLLEYFPKYFTPAQATAYARQPIRIANRAYANRGGNGDEASGDGWLFKGRGPLQLSLKDNYKALSLYVGDPCIMTNPDLVISDYYFESALFYFNENNVWRNCNSVTDASILAVSRAINLGNPNSKKMPNHLEERVYLTKKYYDLLK